jgi:hypothetical protein
MPKTMQERADYWEALYEIEYRKHFPVTHKVNSVCTAPTILPESRPTVFISSSSAKLDTMLNTYYAAGGKRGRGNKRNQILYSDLTTFFFLLRDKGIKLPRWHLSAKACLPELRTLLIKHGYIKSTVTLNMLTGKSAGSMALRKEILHNLERPFVRVASHMPP